MGDTEEVEVSLGESEFTGEVVVEGERTADQDTMDESVGDFDGVDEAHTVPDEVGLTLKDAVGVW